MVFRGVAAVLCATCNVAGCASTPAYNQTECPTWEGLGAIEVNPAGAMDRHLRVQADFLIGPPVEAWPKSSANASSFGTR